LAVALLIVVGGTVCIRLSVTTSQSPPVWVQPALVIDRADDTLATQDIVTDTRDRRAPRAETAATIDLYGNEVSDAVAEYTVDPAGSLYELHSPQTELPRLGIPKS
jgi:hypothetical protein